MVRSTAWHPSARLCPDAQIARHRVESRSEAALWQASLEAANPSPLRGSARTASLHDPTAAAEAAQRKATQLAEERQRSEQDAKQKQQEWEDKHAAAEMRRLRHTSKVTQSQRKDPSAAAREHERALAETKGRQRTEHTNRARSEASQKERQQRAETQKSELVQARKDKAERVNARLLEAARKRELQDHGKQASYSKPVSSTAWIEPVWPLQEPAGPSTPTAADKDRRAKQMQIAPRVDPTALAAQKRLAMATAVAKRQANNPMRYRWRQAELVDIEELRQKCALRGLSTLGTKQMLESRLHFAS